jgi:DNA polymerase III delta prime subunit
LTPLARADVEQTLHRRARAGPPLLLGGPPGSGKTTLLRGLAARLAAQGAVPVYLDLMGAASTPERFVAAALRAIPAEGLGRRLPQATEIHRLAEAGRLHGREAVAALFQLWSGLDEADGRPVVLLLDEATEIRSLAYFPGLRHVHDPFVASLAARRSGTILATSFPSAARRLWSMETLAARPLAASELVAAAGGQADALARASFGWPRYAAILLDAMERSGGAVEQAWLAEMAPGGRLESACRHTYETLLLRSRGYGICKAALGVIAQEEGLNLTALVPRLGRTPGAVRDYLQWLVAVDAIRMLKKRYVYTDGLLRHWVRLHARGVVPTLTELQAAARELVAPAGAPAEAQAPGVVAPPPAAASIPDPSSPARRDSLIEID